jgi:cyclophilin family peptidyl-prolyl cis-trans isomerase
MRGRHDRFLAAALLAVLSPPVAEFSILAPQSRRRWRTSSPSQSTRASDASSSRSTRVELRSRPQTSSYVDTHRFDGQTLPRHAHGGRQGLVQGGITTDARKLFAPIAHEPTTQTGLHNVTGAISMANAGPGTARADFFILLSDMPGLDANGPGGDANGFAAFGHVTEGMDVVTKIFESPVSATKGEGPMKGQMLDPTIKIIKAARLK